MSIYKEDWKLFDQYSDNMVIRDVTNADKFDRLLLGGARKGLWAAFAIYDNRFEKIECVVAGIYSIVQTIANEAMENPRKRPGKTDVHVKRDRIKISSGVMSIFDECFEGEWPESLKNEDIKLNERLEAIWGMPHDDEKTGRQQFFELACHMTQPDGLPAIGSVRHGAFAKLEGKEVEIAIMRDKSTYDVIALEIKPRR